MAQIGAALSGGGHRATIWALGALAYLVDSRLSEQVVSVASVSGGSITNGWLAMAVDVPSITPKEFDVAARALVRHVARDGLLPGRYTRGYLAAVGAAAIAGAATPWAVGTTPAVKALGVPLGAAVGGLVTTSGRGRALDRALARAHFSRSGGPLLLAETRRGVDHVFCATELQSGDHFYMSAESVYGYSFGVGEPADLPLSTAVQCTAALPGAFPPRWLPTKRHGFVDARTGTPSADIPPHLVLTDGGVYDNMADQWQFGFDRRLRRWPALAIRHRQADVLLVINASAGWSGIRRMRAPRVPGAADVQGLMRVKDVMYDVTTAQRRYSLVSEFERAEQEGHGLRGALVHIAQTPLTVAKRVVEDDAAPAGRASRARAVVTLLADDEDEWDAVRDRSLAVRTVLSALGREVTVSLLRHAYTLAMCNLHVVLNSPLLELPSPERVAERFLGS